MTFDERVDLLAAAACRARCAQRRAEAYPVLLALSCHTEPGDWLGAAVRRLLDEHERSLVVAA